jgi:predicted SnoaL-like aldol condensation-catalyzing enzyme
MKKKQLKVLMNMLTVSAGCITRHYDPSQHTSVMKNKNKNKNKEL